MSAALLRTLRDLIQVDVGGRGLRTDPTDNLITACPHDFADACRSVARTEQAKLLVVTGFYIAHARPPCGETDGPLGALFLARALTPLGVEVMLATDDHCVPALRVGLEACGLQGRVGLIELPKIGRDERDYEDQVFGAAGPSPTHLIALERVGPSHTPQSLDSQPGTTTRHREMFRSEVRPEEHGRCYSMRGRDLTEHTSPAHLLFAGAARREPPLPTVGVGDGGNEIGMGKISWDVVRRNIPGGGRIACRVPVDHLIVAGVSNWGAYALAAGVRALRGAAPDAELYDGERERDLLRRMVECGPLVDGSTGRRTATVDGLTWEQYAAVLEQIRALVAAGGRG